MIPPKKARRHFPFSFSRLGISTLFFLCLAAIYWILYASGLFSSLPSSPGWQVPNGSFSDRFASMHSVTCPAKQFIKWFDADYKPVCVPYNIPNPSLTTTNTPPSTGYPTSSPQGEMSGGKFGTYFENIRNFCTGSGIIRGFTAQGQKICINALNRTSFTSNPSPVDYGTSNISYPAKPAMEPTEDWKFRSYFTNMFSPSSPCTSIQGIIGFQNDGTPICANVPVDGLCGTSNGGSYYTAPSTNLCSIWTASSVTGVGPWSWSCSGLDGGTAVNCSANKKVDGGWTAFWSCSVSCWGGTQSRTCTNPAPANGWLACVGSSTQSCNTQPCPVNGLCGTSNGGSYYTAPSTNLCSAWIASSVTGVGPWSWSCSGLNGGTTANCSANKKVDGGWTAFWSCSVSCWGGTQSRTCTNPAPANGWLACVGSSTQSCNTQACVTCSSYAAAFNGTLYDTRVVSGNTLCVYKQSGGDGQEWAFCNLTIGKCWGGEWGPSNVTWNTASNTYTYMTFNDMRCDDVWSISNGVITGNWHEPWYQSPVSWFWFNIVNTYVPDPYF